MPGNNRRYGIKLDRLMAFGIRLVVWYGKLIEGCSGCFKEVVKSGRNLHRLRSLPGYGLNTKKKPLEVFPTNGGGLLNQYKIIYSIHACALQ